MTRESSEYEFARKIIKKEAARPSVYTPNRNEAALARVHKQFGPKAVKEIAREFKKELGLR